MRKIFFFMIVLLSVAPGFAADTNPIKILTWQECRNLTIINNPDLQSAREEIMQSEAYKGIERSVLLPQVSATGVYSKSDSSNETGNSSLYSYSLGVRQLLFDGFSASNAIKSSNASLESVQYNYFAQESDILYTVRIAYVDLIKKQENIKILELLYKRRQANHKLVKMRYKAGREHKGAVLMAEADRDKALWEINTAYRELGLQKEVLLNVIGGKTLQGDWQVTSDFNLLQKIDSNLKPDMASLMQQNPLLKKMIAQTKAACYSKDASYSDYYPKVYAFLNAGTSGSNIAPDNREISGGVEMSIDLFGGGKTYYTSKRYESLYRQSKADEKKVRLAVLITLEKTWSNLITNMKKEDVMLQYLKAAEERAKIAGSQYSIGLISFDNWTIIEEALANALKNYLEARIDLLYAEAEWIQAKGEINSYEK